MISFLDFYNHLCLFTIHGSTVYKRLKIFEPGSRMMPIVLIHWLVSVRSITEVNNSNQQIIYKCTLEYNPLWKE